MEFFARCIRGLEWVVAAELHGRLGATVTSSRHRAVRFAMETGSGEADTVPALLDVRTADDVFALVTTLDDVGHTRAELDRIDGALRDADLAAPRVRLPSIGGAGEQNGRSDRPRRGRRGTVEVVASFVGRRNFSRYELEDVIGPSAAAATDSTYLSRSTVERVTADLTYRVHIDGPELIIGVRVGSHPLHRRAYKRHSGPGSLHPPVAAALALLSGLVPGVRVFDPFCGSGTIPIEAARWLPMLAVGGDLAAPAVADGRRNAWAAGPRLGVRFVRSDAAATPLRPGSVDRVVTNPPWGGQADLGGRRADEGLLPTLAELTATAGRAVLLVDGDPMVERVIDALQPQLVVPVSLFGRHPRIVLCHPDAGPLPTSGLLVEALARSLDQRSRRQPPEPA